MLDLTWQQLYRQCKSPLGPTSPLLPANQNQTKPKLKKKKKKKHKHKHKTLNLKSTINIHEKNLSLSLSVPFSLFVANHNKKETHFFLVPLARGKEGKPR